MPCLPDSSSAGVSAPKRRIVLKKGATLTIAATEKRCDFDLTDVAITSELRVKKTGVLAGVFVIAKSPANSDGKIYGFAATLPTDSLSIGTEYSFDFKLTSSSGSAYTHSVALEIIRGDTA